MNLTKLKDPFPANDIEWRVQQSGVKNDKPWAMVLAYVTNRAIMERLDEICGPDNWANDFKEGPNGGLLCGISVKCGETWVTKWDGADNTQVEAIKGGLSAAMKRAGSQWGIGRYLYKLDATFADITDKGKHRGNVKDKAGKVHYFKWATPQLPLWALPEGAVEIKADPPTKQPAKTPEKDDKPKDTAKWIVGWLTKAKELRKQLGDGPYYEILDKYNLSHANEIKNREKATKVFNSLKVALDMPKKEAATFPLECPDQLDDNGKMQPVDYLECSTCKKREGCPSHE